MMAVTSKQPRSQLRVLVTGGAGFIGSALCRHMVEQGEFTVFNVDKLTYAANLHSLQSIAECPNYQFAEADIADAPRMTELVRDFSPDAIMHLAAETHVDRSIDSPQPFVQTNVVGTAILLDAARRYWGGLPPERRERFRLVMVSTDE